VPFMIAAINIYMTIAVEKIPARYLNPYRTLAAETILFILLCLYMEHSYRHAADKVKLSHKESESRLLQMETEYYKNNLSYVQDSSRIRHDFKQIMITMQTLLADQKYDELSTFMDQYFKDSPLPESTVKYTHSNPLNAVLNHYHCTAEKNHIKPNWKISLPASLQISETDLCTIFGNLLSNAVNGCMTVPEEQRYINLKAEEDENGHFYITQVNSYDGNTKKKDNRFLSTTNGSGIGLGSIQQTAEKYHGMAEFHAGSTEFISSVMLVNASDSRQ
ncbi:MAG: ATP-binding protein, partial [Erysipelotrichaceae bacterium]|nr:ATP-binding protein [Erysipelotrichaceae bacterium]